MFQEHYAGTTLSYWIHESSPEKRESDFLRILMLCCFFGKKSQAMKRPSLRSLKCLPRKDTEALLVVII